MTFESKTQKLYIYLLRSPGSHWHSLLLAVEDCHHGGVQDCGEGCLPGHCTVPFGGHQATHVTTSCQEQSTALLLQMLRGN
jgi:hypothetical protein